MIQAPGGRSPLTVRRSAGHPGRRPQGRGGCARLHRRPGGARRDRVGHTGHAGGHADGHGERPRRRRGRQAWPTRTPPRSHDPEPRTLSSGSWPRSAPPRPSTQDQPWPSSTQLQKQLRAKPGDIFLQAQLTAYKQLYQQADQPARRGLYAQSGTGAQLTVLQPATPLPVVQRRLRRADAATAAACCWGSGWACSSACCSRCSSTASTRGCAAARRSRRPSACRSSPTSRTRAVASAGRAAVAVLGDPVGRVAEAYRSLRTALTMWPSRAIADRDVGSGAGRRTRAVEQEPQGRAGHLGPGRRGQDDHRGQPGRDPGRDRQAGPGDRRRLPQPVACTGCSTSPPAPGSPTCLALDSESDLGRLARLTDDTRIRVLTAGHSEEFRGGMPDPHRGRHRRGPDLRRRGGHRRRPAAQQQRRPGLPSLRRLGGRGGQARPGQPRSRPAGSPTCSGRTRAPVLGVVCIGAAAPVRRHLPSIRTQPVVRVTQASRPGQGGQRGPGRRDRRDSRPRPALGCGAARTCCGGPPAVRPCCCRPRQTMPLVLGGSGAALVGRAGRAAARRRGRSDPGRAARRRRRRPSGSDVERALAEMSKPRAPPGTGMTVADLPGRDDRLARAAASAGLVGAANVAPDRPVDDDTWDALVHLARDQRSTGPLLDAVECGAWPATAAAARHAARHADPAPRPVPPARAHAAAGLSGDLTAHGVPHRVLKGAAVAHLDYAAPRPALVRRHRPAGPLARTSNAWPG